MQDLSLVIDASTVGKSYNVSFEYRNIGIYEQRAVGVMDKNGFPILVTADPKHDNRIILLARANSELSILKEQPLVYQGEIIQFYQQGTQEYKNGKSLLDRITD